MITTAELAKRLGDPSLVVVDVRPMAAYNGWQLQGEVRGGHISGAVACPSSWTDGVEAGDLKTLIHAKGITPDKTVVTYGYTRDESTAVAGKLGDTGYQNVLVYEAGLGEWATNPS